MVCIRFIIKSLAANNISLHRFGKYAYTWQRLHWNAGKLMQHVQLNAANAPHESCIVNQFCWKRQMNRTKNRHSRHFSMLPSYQRVIEAKRKMKRKKDTETVVYNIWYDHNIRCHFVNINYLIIDRIVRLDANAKCVCVHWLSLEEVQFRV